MRMGAGTVPRVHTQAGRVLWTGLGQALTHRGVDWPSDHR